MKKQLRSLFFLKFPTAARLLLLIGLLVSVTAKTQAQKIYYMTSDGAAVSAGDDDAIYARAADGTSTKIAGAITNSPGVMKVDVLHDVAFFTDDQSFSIKKVDLNTGTVSLVLSGLPAAVSGLDYNPQNDYVYYITSDISNSSNNKLGRVKADGTDGVTLYSLSDPRPGPMTLDFTNSRVFYVNNETTEIYAKSISLSNGAVTTLLPSSGGIISATSGVAYSILKDEIYITNTGRGVGIGSNGANVLNAGDAITAVVPNKTEGGYGGTITLGASVAYSPSSLAIKADLADSAAYLVDIHSPYNLVKVSLKSGSTPGAPTTLLTSTAIIKDIDVDNSAPYISVESANTSFTENGAAIGLSPAGIALDEDGNWSGGSFTASISANSETADVLAIGTGTGLSVSGGVISDGGTAFGSISTADGTITGSGILTITFNDNATNTRVQNLLRAITFINTTENFSSASRTVTFSVTDSKGATTPGSRSVTMVPVNDAPVISGGPVSLAGTGTNTPSAPKKVSDIIDGLTFSDADATTSKGMAVTIAVGNGNWQYSTDGVIWTSMGSRSIASALLLSPSSYIRYIGGNTAETAYIMFRAWDSSTGTSSVTGSPSIVNPSSANGGTTAYSADMVTVNIGVTAGTTVNSIARVSSATTNATFVDYAVTFGAAVTGLTADNFSITGIANASVTSVNTADGGTTWTVSVNTGTGDGAVELDLANAAGLSPSITTALPFAGQAYTIDKTAPTVLSITRASANPTTAATVDYTITFSEPVTGVVADDFVLVTDGTDCSPSGFSGSGATYTYTAAIGADDGTFELDLSPAAQGVQDAAGNFITASGLEGETYTIDRTAPIVSLISNVPVVKTGQTATVTFTFSEDPGTTFQWDGSSGDVSLTGGTLSALSGSGLTRTAVFTPAAITSGTAHILVPAGTYTDAAGNPGAASNSLDIAIDNVAPEVSSITRVGAEASNGASAVYTVTFSEPVTGVDASDFTVSQFFGEISHDPLTVTPVDASTYTVNITGITGDARIRLDLNDSDTGITDLAGNAIADGFINGEYYTIDHTPPPVTSGSFSSNGTVDYRWAKVGDQITVGILWGESPATQTATIAGHSVNPNDTNVNFWQYTYTLTADDTEGVIPFEIDATDAAGNTQHYTNTDLTANTVTFDKTATVVSIGNPSVAAVLANGFDQVSYAVTYSDPNMYRIGLSESNITLNTTGSAHADFEVRPVIGSTTDSQVVFYNITGTGTIGFTISAGSATDMAGNPAVASDPSATFTVMPQSNNALLTILTLNPGASLSKVRGPDHADYTATVPNSTATIKVKPITSDAGATLTVNGNPSTPGAESAPITLNADTTSIAVTVTAQDGVTKNTYRVTVTRSPSTNARLTVLSLNPGATLTRVSGPDYADYTATVSNSIGSIKVKPVTSDPTATLTVNGNPSTPGAESDPITLNSDTTSIAVTVTAQDGITKNTYRVTVTRSPSNNARLTVLTLNPGATLTKVSGPDYADYTATVSNSTASVKVKPITSDAGATLTVNGNPSAPGAESSPITLNADTTSIAVTVTAPDGVTKNTYRMVLTRAPSNNARLTVLTLNPGATLTRVSGPDYADYTATVPNSTATIKVKPITSDPMATLTVNGNSSAPGAESAPITLNADTTSIAVTVTAQDGTTRNSYVIKVTRLAPPPAVMAYEQEQATPAERSEVVVHGNVSPNGDGNSDVMQIDGIGSYPDNRVQIMSRSGNLVFETKGYDNTTKVFDGHSNDGKLQQAGTYFYSLEYKVGSETKHKTGYIVLKY